MRLIKDKAKYYINKLTKITGTDMLYITKGSFWSIVDQIVGNGVSLLSAMAFARFLPQETYGTYSFILSWAGIFSMFAMSGVNEALINSVAQGKEGDLQESIKYKLRWGALSFLGGAGFALYYFINGNSLLSVSFLITAIFLPTYLASNVITGYFFAKELFKYNSILNIFVRGTSLVTMVAAVYFTGSVPIILLAYFIPDTIIKFIFILFAIKRHQSNREISDTSKSFAFHFTVMNVLGGVSKTIDSLMLFHLAGAVQVAVYKFAMLPIEKLSVLVNIVFGVGRPRFAKRSYEEIYQTLNKKLIIFNVVVMGAVAVSFILLPWLYKIFFPQYMDSVGYARILLLPFLLVAPTVIHSIWVAKAEMKRLYKIKIFFSVSRIALFLGLIPAYGIAGAVWTNVIAALLLSAVMLVIYIKDRRRFNHQT